VHSPADPPNPPTDARGAGEWRPCLGPVALTAQAVATVGLTLTAVINIPEAMRSAGRATWISYLVATGAVLLVSETLVLFHRLPARPNGIAGYVEAGLGRRPAAVATWLLLLGYSASLLACLAFLGVYVDHLLLDAGRPTGAAIGFLLGGLACFELARRAVTLSTRTMLLTETLSVVIVLALTVLVLQHGGPAQDLRAVDPLGDGSTQVSSALMVAVFSFIGFESAANLGPEALRPERMVPRAMRIAVITAGLLFVFWAVFLPEGLAWLPVAERFSLDAVSDLAERLGRPGAGLWIRGGTFLCLFGSCLGALTALGRVTYALAQERVLPRRLQRLHPRFGTPAPALAAVALPVIGGGALLTARGLGASQLFDLCGGFSVLAFLLVYGLVAFASLRQALPGMSQRRRLLVGGSCLLAVGGVAVGYLASVVGHQNAMLLSFVLLLLAGLGRVWRVVPPDNA